MSNIGLKSGWTTLVKEYAFISLGVVAYALGWTIFLLPNNLVGGGVSGFASILLYATGIPMSVTYLVLNAILLIIGTKILGTGFGGKTIYAIIMTSVVLAVMPKLIPIDFINEFAISNGRLICTILGGVIAGLGIGLSMSQGGSTGGTDIIALVWCKFYPASPGRVILIIDVGIIMSSLLFPSYTSSGELLPFVDKLAIVVYGLIQVTVCGYAIDMYLSGSKQSVQAFIFTKKVDEMADAIAFDMKRGVTVIPAKGWYSKEDRQVLMVVTRKTDLNILLRYVKSIDPDAFLSVSSVMGVYGQGFDTIKVKSSAIVYGPKSVICVCGVNKIVKNIDEAIRRVKTKAAPPNTVRLGIETPCAKTGECISLRQESPDMCAGCHGDGRICCNYVVCAQQRHAGRIKVILIGEEYGY